MFKLSFFERNRVLSLGTKFFGVFKNTSPLISRERLVRTKKVFSLLTIASMVLTLVGPISMVNVPVAEAVAPTPVQIFYDNFEKANQWEVLVTGGRSPQRNYAEGIFTGPPFTNMFVGVQSPVQGRGYFFEGLDNTEIDDNAGREVATMGYSQLRVEYSLKAKLVGPTSKFRVQYNLDDDVASTVIRPDVVVSQEHTLYGFDISNLERHAKLNLQFFMYGVHGEGAGLDNVTVYGYDTSAPTFYEGFENNIVNTLPSSWTVENNPQVRKGKTINDRKYYTDDNTPDKGYGIELNGSNGVNDAISRVISTAGVATGIHVAYARRISDMNNEGEGLRSYYSIDGGSTWQLMEAVENIEPFLIWKSFGPFAGADNNSNFALRFEVDSPLGDKFVRIDDITVWGEGVAPPRNNGIIEGRKYYDVDKSSSYTAGDLPIGVWNVSISGPVNQTTITAGDGNYSFTNLPAGSYLVCEEARSGWEQTYPTAIPPICANGTKGYSVTVSDDTTVSHIDFGNIQTASITIDKVTNPVGDDQEFTFALGSEGSSQNAVLADETTPHTFSGLYPGTIYTLTETDLPGWDLTAATCTDNSLSDSPYVSGDSIVLEPAGNLTCVFTNTKRGSITVNNISTGGTFGYDLTGPNSYHEAQPLTGTSSTIFDDLVNSIGGVPYVLMQTVPDGYTSEASCTGGHTPSNINLAPGENITCTFNSSPLGSISGVKFDDKNGNGTRDDGEPGLVGWEIKISSEGSSLSSFITGADGSYLFTDLPAGSYNLTETQKPGWTQTFPVSGVHIVELALGQAVTDKDFGNFNLGQISGKKYSDLNVNGEDDAGELGLAGWTIYLDANNNGSFDSGEKSNITDADGRYTISDIGPGTHTVREVLEDGWKQTDPTSADSSLGGQNNGSYVVVMTSNGNKTNRNFGNIETGSITVTKTVEGEGPSTGFVFTLNDEDPQTVIGGQSHVYSDLLPGTYQLGEANTAGWELTSAECSVSRLGSTVPVEPSDIALGAGEDVSCIFVNTFVGIDTDDDGIVDEVDNCPLIANTDQADNDDDGIGDVCDNDDDNDEVLDTVDNCPLNANASQADNDDDGVGDVCDNDDDNDGVLDTVDNCQFTANADQADSDEDGIGNVCDENLCPSVVVVSNTASQVVESETPAVLAFVHSTWTALIDGASWIWKTYLVEDPAVDQTYTFERTFNVAGTVTTASLIVAADNGYVARLNGSVVGTDMGELNYTEAGKDTYDIASLLVSGENNLSIETKNFGDDGLTAEQNPAGLLYRLEANIAPNTCSGGGDQNNAPVITAPTTMGGKVGQLVQFTVSATDPDDVVTLSASNLPSGATFNPANGLFNWLPTSVGSSTVTFSVTDGSATDTEDTVITIAEQTECRLDDVYARVNISEVVVNGTGSFTSRIYLGSATNILLPGTWFPMYNTDGSAINDPDIITGGYDNVPGIAVQRISGELRVFQYGWYAGTLADGYPNNENVRGTIDFSGVSATSHRSDIEDNKIEEVGSSTTTTPDVITITEGGDVEYYLRTSVKSDAFYITTSEQASCDVNHAPVFTGPTSASGKVGDNITFVVTASDSDSDPLTLTQTLPEGATYNSETGQFSWTPTSTGTFTATFNANDGTDTTTLIVSISVDSANNGGGGGGGGGGGFILPIGPNPVDITVAEGSNVQNRNITLVLTYGAEVTSIAIGNLSDLSDSIGFEAPTSTKLWVLPGDFGSKTIYARFRNASGGVTDKNVTVTYAVGQVLGEETSNQGGEPIIPTPPTPPTAPIVTVISPRPSVSGVVLGEQTTEPKPAVEDGAVVINPEEKQADVSPTSDTGTDCYRILSICWWWWLLLILVLIYLWWAYNQSDEEEGKK